MKNNIYILVFVLGVIGCSASSDGTKIGDAQFCLDKLSSSATAAEVNACLEPIASLTSTSAEAVRCGAMFQREGFTNPQTYIDAMNEVNNGGGPMSMMNLLAFHTAGTIATDDANASSAFTTCTNSGGKGATLLAAFSYLGTNIYRSYAVGGAGNTACSSGCSATPSGTGGVYDVNSCLTSVAGNATCLLDIANGNSGSAGTLMNSIGTVVLATNSVSCSGSSNASNTLCTLLSNVVASGGGAASPKCVGFFFFKNLAAG